MTIAVLALSVRGAMGQYLYCWLDSLGKRAKVLLFAPSHYAYRSENVHFVPFATGSSRALAGLRMMDPLASKSLAKKILAFCPDVVHVFSGEGYPWARNVVHILKKASVPIVTTVHDVEPHSADFLGRLNSLFRAFVLRESTFLHVHTRSALELLKQNGHEAAKAFVIPHGNIGEVFLRHDQEHVSKEEAILFFGRIETYKGIDIMLRASRILGDRFLYIIAGPGRIRSRDIRFIEQATDLRFEIHNSYLSDYQVCTLFRRARICVMPYRDASQSSLPGISALFGVPVVASDVGGLAEDVLCINGVLVRPNDPSALARGILEASGRPVRVPGELSFERLSDRFLEIYAHATERRKGTSGTRTAWQ
jgi:glycosyltransferase involved in cell wall biosynthesis